MNGTSPSQEVKPFLTVYTMDKDHKKHSFVAFATKLQFRLRYAGIPYEDGAGSRSQAPKDKLPYVKFHETGELMGDSTLITQKLVEMGKMEDLSENLSPEQRAMDFCLRSMVEDRMYYLLLYERWFENFKEMRDHGPFGHLPGGVRHIVCASIFQYIRLMLYFQGTGRHKASEIRHFRAEALGSLGDFTAAAIEKAKHRPEKEPFWILGGEKPTEADFSVFGYLSGLLATTTQPDTVSLIKQHPALLSYIHRIHNAYFSDFHGLV